MAKLSKKDRLRYMEKIRSELIPTWQSLSAIAYRTGLSVKTCETILVEMYNNGEVKCTRTYIDGHNRVHLFKKLEFVTVLGRKMTVETSEVEA